jgi:hypothetical protein
MLVTLMEPLMIALAFAAGFAVQLVVSGHPTTSSHRALERGSYVSM